MFGAGLRLKDVEIEMLDFNSARFESYCISKLKSSSCARCTVLIQLCAQLCNISNDAGCTFGFIGAPQSVAMWARKVFPFRITFLLRFFRIILNASAVSVIKPINQ